MIQQTLLIPLFKNKVNYEHIYIYCTCLAFQLVDDIQNQLPVSATSLCSIIEPTFYACSGNVNIAYAASMYGNEKMIKIAMKKLGNILKCNGCVTRDQVKRMYTIVSLISVYWCESWTMENAERRKRQFIWNTILEESFTNTVDHQKYKQLSYRSRQAWTLPWKKSN